MWYFISQIRDCYTFTLLSLVWTSKIFKFLAILGPLVFSFQNSLAHSTEELIEILEQSPIESVDLSVKTSNRRLAKALAADGDAIQFGLSHHSIEIQDKTVTILQYSGLHRQDQWFSRKPTRGKLRAISLVFDKLIKETDSTRQIELLKVLRAVSSYQAPDKAGYYDLSPKMVTYIKDNFSDEPIANSLVNNVKMNVLDCMRALGVMPGYRYWRRPKGY